MHEPLEGGPCVCQTEGRALEATHPARRDKGCPFLIFLAPPLMLGRFTQSRSFATGFGMTMGSAAPSYHGGTSGSKRGGSHEGTGWWEHSGFSCEGACRGADAWPAVPWRRVICGDRGARLVSEGRHLRDPHATRSAVGVWRPRARPADGFSIARVYRVRWGLGAPCRLPWMVLPLASLPLLLPASSSRSHREVVVFALHGNRGWRPRQSHLLTAIPGVQVPPMRFGAHVRLFTGP